jgi:prepilin-type N-terminal cleavage/methylation domain-containing protein
MTDQGRQSGLTLVEVLVSMVLLSILLVPAIQALQTGVAGSNVHAEITDDQFRVVSRLEELIAEPFADLSLAATGAGGAASETTYSELPGVPGRLLVYLAFYDGDNADTDNNPFTGGEADLIWIRIAAEGTVFELQTVTANGL